MIRRIVRAAMLAAISSSLYAVDGVVLIDQNRAMAGNITPGDLPGFPVTISLPGSYRLSGNVTVPDTVTNAIHIAADHVTLDLNGFSIIGPNVCTPNPTTCTVTGGGVGIHAGDFNVGTIAPRGVRVLNGTVRGMGFHGVRMQGEGTFVERVNTHSNGGPGIVVGGTVIDSAVVMNGGTGIIALTVRGSIAEQNRLGGIFVRASGLAIGNQSSFNGGDGMNATKATIGNNTVTNNQGFGISVTCPSSVVGNTTVDNQLGNIRTIGACTLADNAQ
jgi:hypothetical protein